MTPYSQPLAPPAPLVENVARPAAVHTPAKLAAKAAKKERKHARLRWFFSWCWGCQYMGGSF
ncbi:hypothetical protein [Hymenobacter nivis]|uniref:Uncharacterized protein n=1 Tax=Hymenobacter nivis TaxID=1850093 RepID=A0A502GZU9_9BACT|nr:hypothetical protein [Hymenobacter nivis]TPG66670.1 hypothetical protein EAH73_09785 [Hymenobacter nivis]